MTNQPKGFVTINLDRIVERLNLALDAHLVSLRNALRSIEDGSYLDRGRTAPAQSLIQFQISTTIDTVKAEQEEIRKAFLATVRTFTDFVDTLLAVQKLKAMPQVVTRPLDGLDEVSAYVESLISASTQKVGADGHSSGPSKVASIGGLSPFSSQAVSGYFEVRRALEHHKAIAASDIVLANQYVCMTLDDQDVTVPPPFEVEAGQRVGIGWRQQTRTISKGEQINLTELEVEGVVRTLRVFVAPELVRSMLAKRAAQQA